MDEIITVESILSSVESIELELSLEELQQHISLESKPKTTSTRTGLLGIIDKIIDFIGTIIEKIKGFFGKIFAKNQVKLITDIESIVSRVEAGISGALKASKTAKSAVISTLLVTGGIYLSNNKNNTDIMNKLKLNADIVEDLSGQLKLYFTEVTKQVPDSNKLDGYIRSISKYTPTKPEEFTPEEGDIVAFLVKLLPKLNIKAVLVNRATIEDSMEEINIMAKKLKDKSKDPNSTIDKKHISVVVNLVKIVNTEVVSFMRDVDTYITLNKKIGAVSKTNIAPFLDGE